MSIKIRDLKKSYSNGKVTTQILNGVNFDVKDGETLVIIGPSGSGKSTLLNLLGGLMEADSGEILIDDKDITKLNAKEIGQFRRNTFGFIYQFYNLIPDLTVYENVEVCWWLGDRTRSIEDILKRVNLWEHRNKFPDELSGGMQQRASIARAISKNPRILFCDEPTGALDYKSAHDVLEIMEMLQKESSTIMVIVTHNIAISQMANHIIEIRDGEVALDKYNDNPITAKEVYW